jgi:hypothetical protein
MRRILLAGSVATAPTPRGRPHVVADPGSNLSGNRAVPAISAQSRVGERYPVVRAEPITGRLVNPSTRRGVWLISGLTTR